jgi:hypothetical protein
MYYSKPHSSEKRTLNTTRRMHRYHAIAASTRSTRTLLFFDSILQHFDFRLHKSIVLLSTIVSEAVFISAYAG